MFCHIGICEQVPESLMNAIGGLSGCGPAFVSLYSAIKLLEKQREREKIEQRRRLLQFQTITV